MNIRRRRQVSALVLLAVYLPLLLTMLHTHRPTVYVDDVCTQCVHHEPHAGHFSAQTASLHECVLCQLTTLQYVLPAAVVFSVLLLVNGSGVAIAYERLVPLRGTACQSPRAPPFLAV